MSLLSWIGLVASIVVLVVVSRKSLWFSLLGGGLLLGLFTVPLTDQLHIMIGACIDPGNLLLGGAMALIPVIGAFMEHTGQMDALVGAMRMDRRAFNALAPALIGLLPVAGGALISAPLVNRGSSRSTSPEKRCALNVWFRHVLFLVYPASSALIISADIAGFDVYTAILYLSPFLGLTVLLGYVFFLRDMKGKVDEVPGGGDSRNGFVKSLVVLLATPAIDICLRWVFQATDIYVENLSLFIGVSTSATLSAWWGRPAWNEVVKLVKEAKPWNFFLFILAMFIYLGIFGASGIPEMFASYSLPPFILLAVLGFTFGFITGRVQVPAAILMPLYMTTYSLDGIGPLAFVSSFMSIYMGYVVSPVHPCLSVTLEYFHVDYSRVARLMLPPVAISMGILSILSFLA